MSIGTLDLSTALAALYLPGGPRPFEPARRLWKGVDHVLRADQSGPECLERAGFRQEALLLASRELREWAGDQVQRGSCLAANDERYPQRWLRVLGHAAPPVLWIAGEMPPGPFLSVVGSRVVGRRDVQFAQEIGRAAVALGYSIASGSAAGCDAAAVSGVGALAVELLPRGLSEADSRVGRCRLSVRPPGESFSGTAAMERNTLIYAISDHAVVVHARLNDGGTWKGSQIALRRKLCTLLVRVRPNDPASRALIALGGVPIERPDELQAAFLAEPQQLRYWKARHRLRSVHFIHRVATATGHRIRHARGAAAFEPLFRGFHEDDSSDGRER